MTPSEIRKIAFFYDVMITDKTDSLFIDYLDSQEVTYKLEDPQKEILFAIYDKYAPDTDNEWAHVTAMIETLKSIESIQFKFLTVDGSEAINTEEVLP